jgi:hypothetical protein
VPLGVCGSFCLSGSCTGARTIGPGVAGGCGCPLGEGGGGCGCVLEGCAHGGRSGFSCAQAGNAPAKSANGAKHQIEIRATLEIIK